MADTLTTHDYAAQIASLMARHASLATLRAVAREGARDLALSLVRDAGAETRTFFVLGDALHTARATASHLRATPEYAMIYDAARKVIDRWMRRAA